MKVVAHLRGGKLVKGYTDTSVPYSLEEMLKEDPESLPPNLSVQQEGSEKKIKVSLNSLKALFFVKTFEGSKEYKEIKFFHAHPPIEGLWVRIHFGDGEYTEGVVRNSLRYLVEPGFFLKPPDPHSNNQLVYAVKASVVEFRVLGVRTAF